LTIVVVCAAAFARADAPGDAPSPLPVQPTAPTSPPPATPATGSATEPPPATKALDPKDMRTLTDDPILAKASRVEGEEVHGVVAFTFDDGPNPETTPAVIDALEKYDVPATFFIVTSRIVGKHGEKSRDVLARELDAGFTVGDHSSTHPNLKEATGDELTREIDQSIRTLALQTNRPIGMFRPPYGALSGAGRMRLKRLGVTEVIWSIDTLDWQAHNPERLRKKVITMIDKQNGGIVLMHDVKPITAKIIASVLDDLEAENCQRLADGKDAIVPVSIHYFLRDGKTPRAIPDEVTKRTDAYKAKLPGRCQARSQPSPVGDFPKRVDSNCKNNPLAKGCM
jgi:peptidoglycan/xylan/chitin deacetylase (PgdA/CDA1 family)